MIKNKEGKLYTNLNLKIEGFEILNDFEMKFENKENEVFLEINSPAEKSENWEFFIFFEFEVNGKFFTEMIFFSVNDFEDCNQMKIVLEIDNFFSEERSKKMKIFNKKNNLNLKNLDLLLKEFYVENKSVFIRKKNFSFEENLAQKFKIIFKFEKEVFYYYTVENQLLRNIMFFIIDYIIYFLPLYFLKVYFVNQILKLKLFK